jgi:choline-sulfatase
MRILYLDIDTLRADHLGCYGYHRDTSPNLDRIAAQGVRFDNYYCSDAPCLPSRTALSTGRFGIHTGVVNHGGLCADLRPVGSERGFRDGLGQFSLFGTLRRAGLRTVSFSPFADRHSTWSFYAGFQEMHDPAGKGGGESAEEITPAALDWIARNAADDNWFLHINIWDPHTPYRAPAEFGNPFENDPLPEWLTEDVLARHQKTVGPHTSQEVNMYDSKPNPKHPRHVPAIHTMDDLRRHIDGYDCGIAYADQHCGQILDALAAAGVQGDTVVIISSDHGENQGELGIYAEHATADNITCRIPMIVRWPGKASGVVDSGLHYNLDLAPTMADLLDVEPDPNWDGQSYAAALTDGADCGREQLVVSQCCHVCQRGVRWGDWLYMRTYHDGYHLFPRDMLFNLADDPHEQHSLANERPELVREGVYRLAEWHDQMMHTMPHGYGDPLWTTIQEGGPFHARGHLAKYCERLEATGRGHAVPELKRRHPHEFK